MIKKEKLRKIWKALIDSPRAKKVQKIVRRVIIAALFGVIVYQLFLIGWQEVLRSLPTEPLFYILFLVLYVTLPIAETFIYRQVWAIPKVQLFKTVLTKKIYNDEIVGYSGEFYLFIWARKHLNKRDSVILKNLRDNNILSVVTSNFVALSLIGALVFTGIIDIGDLVPNVNFVYVTIALIIAILLVILFIQFRKYLFDLPLKKAFIIFSIYLFRFVLHNSLLVVQWAVVIPQTPLSTWLIFLAITIVVNRIPFLPSRDLVFMWAGIELSRVLNMTTASVAGMLLVSSVLKKCTNLILLLLLPYFSDAPDIKQMREQKQISKIIQSETD
ncbi:hypothetical protein [Rhodohalobacter sp. 614A]|uniref:hypothetical protein n=1 Tax=Rhodohalobacter sp. 614A TaxID=2908649 RepID=UPI001F27A2D6|nr:hypothetical protein [Rhodohalobacter sp. 614A]